MHLHAMDLSERRARRLLACLGDPSRFRLARCLLDGERCVTDLAVEVGLSQSCTTRHLQALQREGVVLGSRDGKRVMFRLCRELPDVGALLEWALIAGATDELSLPIAGARLHPDTGTPGWVPSRPNTSREAASAAAPGTESSRLSAVEAVSNPGLVGPVEPGSEEPGEATAPAESRRPVREELEDYLL